MKRKAFDKIKMTFAGEELLDDLMEDLKRLEELIEVAQTRKRKRQEAKDEVDANWQKKKQNL